MRDLDSELWSLGLTSGEYVYFDGTNFVGSTPSSSNIGNADLTIDTSGARKLILGGATGSDYFTIKDSTDTTEYFRVEGGGTSTFRGTSSSTINAFQSGGTNNAIFQGYNYSGTRVFLLGQSAQNSFFRMYNSAGATKFDIDGTTGRIDAYQDIEWNGAGSHKMILGGALSTDEFTIRNSADTADFFKVNGVGAVWSDGGTGSDTNTWYGSTVPASYAGSTHQNSAFGDEALDALTTGYQNTAVGYKALTTASTGLGNTAVGQASLRDHNGQYSTAIGWQAGFLSTGSSNTFVGAAAGRSKTGGNSVAIGANALYSSLSGGASTAVGVAAGQDITTGGIDSVFIGKDSGRGVTTGSYNTFIGKKTGLSTTLANHVIISDGQENDALTKDNNDNVWFGDNSALATTATNGFVYVRGGAGVPTGTPATSVTGHVPMYADTTNNKLYIYSGGSWVALN
jgi:hypothetical protein